MLSRNFFRGSQTSEFITIDKTQHNEQSISRYANTPFGDAVVAPVVDRKCEAINELSVAASIARICFVDWMCRVMSELPPEAILKLAWHTPHKTSLSLFVVFRNGYLTRRFGVNLHLIFGFFGISIKADSKQSTQKKLQCMFVNRRTDIR